MFTACGILYKGRTGREVLTNVTIKLEHIGSLAKIFTRAGEASSDLKNMLKQLGVSPDVVRKVSIAMYEGEINMVIHANGGMITVFVTQKRSP